MGSCWFLAGRCSGESTVCSGIVPRFGSSGSNPDRPRLRSDDVLPVGVRRTGGLTQLEAQDELGYSDTSLYVSCVAQHVTKHLRMQCGMQ